MLQTGDKFKLKSLVEYDDLFDLHYEESGIDWIFDQPFLIVDFSTEKDKNLHRGYRKIYFFHKQLGFCFLTENLCELVEAAKPKRPPGHRLTKMFRLEPREKFELKN